MIVIVSILSPVMGIIKKEPGCEYESYYTLMPRPQPFLPRKHKFLGKESVKAEVIHTGCRRMPKSSHVLYAIDAQGPPA